MTNLRSLCHPGSKYISNAPSLCTAQRPCKDLTICARRANRSHAGKEGPTGSHPRGDIAVVPISIALEDPGFTSRDIACPAKSTTNFRHSISLAREGPTASTAEQISAPSPTALSTYLIRPVAVGRSLMSMGVVAAVQDDLIVLIGPIDSETQ
eukprot:1685820-Amphidinium_carterae.5